MDINCPVCRKNDNIQKVSAIVTNGVSSGVYSGPSGGVIFAQNSTSFAGGYSTLSGSSSTVLAKLLMPYSEPEKKSASGCGTWALAIIGCLFIFTFGTGIGSQSNVTGPDAVGRMFITVFLVMGIFLFTVFYVANQKSKEYEKIYLDEMSVWKKQIDAWDQLYYCFRNDLVFNPITGEHFPPAQMKDYLSRNSS